MTTDQLIATLEGRGIQIAVKGRDLLVRPRESITSEILGQLRHHKAELLSALRDRVVEPESEPTMSAGDRSSTGPREDGDDYPVPSPEEITRRIEAATWGPIPLEDGPESPEPCPDAAKRKSDPGGIKSSRGASANRIKATEVRTCCRCGKVPLVRGTPGKEEGLCFYCWRGSPLPSVWLSADDTTATRGP